MKDTRKGEQTKKNSKERERERETDGAQKKRKTRLKKNVLAVSKK